MPATTAIRTLAFRGVYTSSGTIRVEDTSPKTLKEFKLNWFTRPLARLLFGPLTARPKALSCPVGSLRAKRAFCEYACPGPRIKRARYSGRLRAGRVFVGFDMIADSSGFRWFAAAGTNQTVMGEAAPFSPANAPAREVALALPVYDPQERQRRLPAGRPCVGLDAAGARQIPGRGRTQGAGRLGPLGLCESDPVALIRALLVHQRERQGPD